MSRKEIKLINSNLMADFILFYPLLNLSVCYIFAGDKMATFSLLCSWISLLIIRLVYKPIIKLTKIECVACFLAVLTLLFTFLRDSVSNMSLCVSFITLIFMMLTLSDSRLNPDVLKALFINREKINFVVQIGFLLILGYYTFKNGLTVGWSTWVLQGPYNYPHTLAYIFFFYAMLNLFYFKENKSIRCFVLSVTDIGLIFLTAVRTTILAGIMILLYLLHSFANRENLKYLILVISGFVVAGYFAFTHGYFDAVLAKNSLALQNSSFTNGRFSIAVNSLKALANGNGIINILSGIGMDGLIQSNFITMNVGIHAHNDFIDILVCYGIINFILYCFSFYRYAKNNLVWISVTIGLLAFANGLFVYMDCIPLLIIGRLFFDKN